MKFEAIKFESVTSTNDIAIDLIKKKEKVYGCVIANSQKKGRGTYGKKWVSKKGNLFLSIFFPLEKKYPSFKEFSIINPVILIETLKDFCDIKKLSIKFPNDVFYNKKKICGLLQELITLEHRNFLIIGIGMNIVSNPNINHRYKATNIYLETKKKISIKKIANLIMSSYENFFINLKSYNYENFKIKAEEFSLK